MGTNGTPSTSVLPVLLRPAPPFCRKISTCSATVVAVSALITVCVKRYPALVLSCPMRLGAPPPPPPAEPQCPSAAFPVKNFSNENFFPN